MSKVFKLTIFIMFFLTLLASFQSGRVNAAILDYQIVRLISMDSDCRNDELKRVEEKDGTLTFLVSCTNVSHYPNGVKVQCTDVDNERSCKIMTQAREFEHLNLLQPQSSSKKQ